jgi:hypothetical protein
VSWSLVVRLFGAGSVCFLKPLEIGRAAAGAERAEAAEDDAEEEEGPGHGNTVASCELRVARIMKLRLDLLG